MQSTIKALLFASAIAGQAASAAPHPAALDSCASAFMQTLARRGAPVKLLDTRLITTSMSPGAIGSLVLTASDAHDSHTVGRALCKVDAHGRVLQLQEIPALSLP